MIKLLRQLFFILLIKPFIVLVMGLNVRYRKRLPIDGPAIIVANHNSHLDTMVLMTLFPMHIIHKVHPVAAADYFLKKKWLAWFSLNIIGIIPFSRRPKKTDGRIFGDIEKHFKKNNIVIYFPEGTRGEPEEMAMLKKGIAHLAKDNPKVPVYPIFMRGLGKALPKDESLLVPFVIDVAIGEPRYGNDEIDAFMSDLNKDFDALSALITQ